jgi:hypothetical protein
VSSVLSDTQACTPAWLDRPTCRRHQGELRGPGQQDEWRSIGTCRAAGRPSTEWRSCESTPDAAPGKRSPGAPPRRPDRWRLQQRDQLRCLLPGAALVRSHWLQWRQQRGAAAKELLPANLQAPWCDGHVQARHATCLWRSAVKENAKHSSWKSRNAAAGSRITLV